MHSITGLMISVPEHVDPSRIHFPFNPFRVASSIPCSRDVNLSTKKSAVDSNESEGI